MPPQTYNNSHNDDDDLVGGCDSLLHSSLLLSIPTGVANRNGLDPPELPRLTRRMTVFVPTGGFVIIDDWGTWPSAQLAVIDFLEQGLATRRRRISLGFVPLPRLDLFGTASPDCQETARGGARGSMGRHMWQSHGVYGLIM